MCQKAKIVSKTQNGYVLQCKLCQSYQVTFGNIFLEFTPEEMNHFKKFLTELNVDYLDQFYGSVAVKRNISIPTMQSNLQIILSQGELIELRCLLGISKVDQNELLDSSKVDYTVVLN